MYHHDGDDAWRAIETLQRHGAAKEDQAKFLGANALRLYRVQAPANTIHERVTEIEVADRRGTPRLIASRAWVSRR